MKRLIISTLIFQLLLFFTTTLLYGQKLYDPPNRLWKPVQDEVYLQEVATKIQTEKPVQAIALLGESCFVVIDGQINTLKNEQLGSMEN